MPTVYLISAYFAGLGAGVGRAWLQGLQSECSSFSRRRSQILRG
jgi:hypothetical protein